MITREKAAEIALAYAKEQNIGIGIYQILLSEDLTDPKPVLYNCPLDNAWVAYIEKAQIVGLCSSTIIVICRSSGEIRYAGSAGDEG